MSSLKSYEFIKLVCDDRGVATLSLARPEKHNALNEKMMREITDACDVINKDAAVRVVILSAEGKSFCAGGDLKWMQSQMNADRKGKMEQAKVLADMLLELDMLQKPLIGKVEGNAFGGGIGMMAVCDIVIAKPGLKFALTETKLGLIPATIGPFVLRSMVEAYSRQVFFTAETFSSNFALSSGLVSQICEDAQIESAIEVHIEAILKTQPPAVTAAKQLLQQLRPGNLAEEVELSITALVDIWETDEAKTQIEKFFSGK